MLNISIEVWGAAFCVMGAVSVVLFSTADRSYRNSLLMMYVAEAFALTGDALANMFNGRAGIVAWLATHLGHLAYYVGSYSVLGAYVSYLCDRLGEGNGREYRKTRIVAWAICCIWSLMVFTGIYYYMDASNMYQRGNLYLVAHLPIALVSLVGITYVLKSWKTISPVSCICMLFYSIAPLVGTIAQLCTHGLNFTAITIAVGLTVLFMEMQGHSARLLQTRTEQLARSREELAETRIAVMVSQIQPHFLFNTLDSIYYLCVTDPSLAADAVDKFSTYLRANLASLDRKTPIPLSTEMAHVRTYLELEKMSKAELLDYSIDVQSSNFAVPALAVQTLVENAVRHGTGKRAHGGTVSVVVADVGDVHEITVADDGVGFSVEDGMPPGRHMGIQNTRARLEAMCEGELEVQSEPGQGTTAIIRIPREVHHEDTRRG